MIPVGHYASRSRRACGWSHAIVWLGLLGWSAQSRAADWPQWRGPSAQGVAETSANPPVTWSEQENVRWKQPLPGLGHSSPVVWHDRVYLTTAIPVGPELEPAYSQAEGAHDNAPVTHRHQFVVLALDRADGHVVWSTTVGEHLPHEQGHFTGSLASASPATDGAHIYVSFGSYGVFCLDTEGKVVWQRDFGLLQSKHGHGEGSSPLLVDGRVVLNWDHEGQSFLICLNAQNGETIWQTNREEVTSWATPIVAELDGKRQLVVSGSHRVRGYDLATGDEIWQCGGLSQNIVATPVYADGVVVVGSSYELQAMLGIRLRGARGDVSGTDQVIWKRDRATPYVPSPLLYDDTVYFLRHYQGVLSRVRASTGEELPGPLRLGPLRDIYASPVGAAGRVYITDLDGLTAVVSHGEISRLLVVNRLDDSFAASAAIAGADLFLRGRKHLYCLSKLSQ